MQPYCYRSTPRQLGAFIDSLYQHPILLALAVLSIIGIGMFFWRKKEAEKI